MARKSYFAVTKKTTEELHRNFVQSVFQDSSVYGQYKREFDAGRGQRLLASGLDEFERSVPDGDIASVGHKIARDYYAVTRELQPEVAVETGVCNGVSTMAILAAMDNNGTGTLYSIDYPMRADESPEEFRAETFAGYGGATILSDKDPGWIIPG